MLHLPEVGVTIDKVASKMNASRRTLQLRLTDRGTNFLKILQEARSCAAIRYLSNNRLAMSEIAFFAWLFRSRIVFKYL